MEKINSPMNHRLIRRIFLGLLFVCGGMWSISRGEDEGHFRSPMLKPPSLGMKSDSSAPANKDYARLGINAYINKEDDNSISYLKKALLKDPADEKVKKLLLKVLFRAIRDEFEKGNYKKAWNYVQDAKRYFPDNSELQALGNTIPNPEPRPARSVVPKTETEKKPVRAREPQAVPIKTEELPRPATETPTTVDSSIDSVLYTIIVFMGLLLAIIVGFQQQNRKLLLKQLDSAQEHLRQADQERAFLMAKLNDQAEYQKNIEKIRHEESQKFYMELKALKIENESLGAERPVRAERIYAEQQERNVKEIAVNMTPPEREEATNRIAAQAQLLYETSPRDAVLFIRKLSQDANHLTRLMIVPALSQIRDIAILDILLGLKDDENYEVRRETLKQLQRLKQMKLSDVSPEYAGKIRKLLDEERDRGEWIL